MGRPWRWIVHTAALHLRWGSILAAVELYKVGFQPSAPDISKWVEAAENLLVRTDQESYDPQTTWPRGDSVPFPLIQASLARRNVGNWESPATGHRTERRLSVVSLIEIPIAADDKRPLCRDICDWILAPNLVTFIWVRRIVKAVQIEV
ncbi:hypothetical protein V8E53_003869 [Lactarius tabidus]